MNQSGNFYGCSTDPGGALDRHENGFVRFYYGEHTGKKFKAMAFDDFEPIEADLHEEKLQQEGIDYLRIEL